MILKIHRILEHFAIFNRYCGQKEVGGKGGVPKHETFRGSCPPRGYSHEDTAGDAIPYKPETDVEVDIRQVVQNFALDKADG